MEEKLRDNGLGERLASLRKLNALTLEQVAERAALTKSYLSKLERGLSSPTLGTLLKLAKALDVTVDQLIGKPAQSSEILLVRAADRVPFSPSRERQGYIYEAIATERLDKAMTPFMMTPPFSVGDGKQRNGREELVSHAGEELIYVVSGDMEVIFADHTVAMTAGDSLYFNASLQHRSRSTGTTPAQALVVVSDPTRRRGSSVD
ncbi:helix-turn-helix domain-containing protein [Bordetella sp. LUAb4]|uniref:helix-turn-helix domain-containing protein n=1 Tax=Bordetella sp. LUAb4 TaxID=2843195 RepID=UPI001E443F30|nr:XRE family transcriptional regulator [Bordetella sp. LUAb4]